MRNYIYRSDRKIKLFYPQIERKWLDKFALKLGANVGVLKAEIASDHTFESSQEKRLQKIIQHLRSRKEIGTIAEPLKFFRGRCRMKLIVDGSHAFFVGRTEPKESAYYVGLCCSLEHMTGYDNEHAYKEEKNIYNINSSNFGFSSVLHKIVKEEELYAAGAYKKKKKEKKSWLAIDFESGPKDVLAAVVRAANNWPQPRYPYEFLAITMSRGSNNGDNVLVGSPLFVDQLGNYEEV